MSLEAVIAFIFHRMEGEPSSSLFVGTASAQLGWGSVEEARHALALAIDAGLVAQDGARLTCHVEVRDHPLPMLARPKLGSLRPAPSGRSVDPVVPAKVPKPRDDPFLGALDRLATLLARDRSELLAEVSALQEREPVRWSAAAALLMIAHEASAVDPDLIELVRADGARGR